MYQRNAKMQMITAKLGRIEVEKQKDRIERMFQTVKNQVE
jgi:hypothetical protein